MSNGQRSAVGGQQLAVSSQPTAVVGRLSPAFFPGRLGLQQRVLPAYRAAFFDALAAACAGGLGVFAGRPLPIEAIEPAAGLETAQLTLANNRHFSHPGSPLYLCWQPDILRWLEEWQPQALIVEANPRYRSTPAAVRWMHARQRPVIAWGLGAVPVGTAGGWKRLLNRYRLWGRRRFLFQFDALIAYSEQGAAQYRALGFPAGRVFVAPNAVAPRPTAPPPARPSAFSSAPRVLFVGRLQARKRVDLLLQACAALPPELRARLTIVGDGPELPHLQSLAAQIYPTAEFTGGLHGAALEAYFAAADVFVLPGSGGLAVQQAMAHALPVIVAEADGTQSSLLRPETGWQLPPGDLAGLTHTLQTALSDAARLRRMGAEAYRVAAEEVNIERMVEVFVEALSSVKS